MKGLSSLQRGITAIGSGSYEEGERLLVLALRDETLSPDLRALVYIWMAEIKSSKEEKIACFQQALAEDPGNINAKERLTALLSLNLPSTPVKPTPDLPLPGSPVTPPTTPQVMPQYPPQYVPPTPTTVPQYVPATVSAQQIPGSTGAFYRTVGIVDGTNGPATAFFITTGGLLATTRFAVSGMHTATIELEPNRLQSGQIVRSYPEFDLAFIQIEVSMPRTLTFTRMPQIPDNMPLTAIAHNGITIQGIRRTTKRELKAHWIPTSFRKLPDAGGNPILDRSNHVVGMLTQIASRSSNDVFGLDIHLIRARADEYLQDIMQNPNQVYCAKCGNLSLAGGVGGFYCESCGGILHHATAHRRFVIPEFDRIYSENMAKPCPSCKARVGYWNGKCLRCGGEATI